MQNMTKPLFLAALITGLTGCQQTMQSFNGFNKPVESEVAVTAEKVDDLAIAHDFSMPALKMAVAPVTLGVEGISPQVADGIHAQLSESLMQIPNATVLDRAALTQISQELEIANTGMADTSDRINPYLGLAGLIVQCTVTQFNEAADGERTGTSVDLGQTGSLLSVVGLDSVGTVLSVTSPEISNESQKITSNVSLQVRVVDAETGALVTSTTSTGSFSSVKKASATKVAGIGGENSSFSEANLQEATKAAINDAVLKIYQSLKSKV